MNHALSEKLPGRPRILVAPLDWGLGHATRCIPVIYELKSRNIDVWLAGEGAQESLLRAEFPSLPFLSLKGYRVRYGKSAGGLLRQIFRQLPRIIRNIQDEHDWLNQIQKTYHFDAIISDNRFGLHHPDIYSVFITHQLYIKSPWRWMEKMIQKRNYRYINQFNECWVPDNENEPTLAGRLSHPIFKPKIPVHYIGYLSRLQNLGQQEEDRHLFISLSGPEPQRSILENLLIHELGTYQGNATVVRGLPHAQRLIPSTNQLHFHNHLYADDYNKEMEKASLIISRSGYSTVMDIARLARKAVFIPTPGQPEQEYLAAYLEEQGFAPFLDQKEFSLQKALEKADAYSYRNIPGEESSLKNTIDRLLEKITQS